MIRNTTSNLGIALIPQATFDWKKLLPIAAVLIAAWLLLSGRSKKERKRRAMSKARTAYRRKVGRIEARYA